MSKWQYGYCCLSCGTLADGKVPTIDRAPCEHCGSALGYVRTTFRHTGWLGRRLEFTDVDGGKDLFLRLLAIELEIEADGGDSPAAFLTSAIKRARQKVEPSTEPLHREIAHSFRLMAPSTRQSLHEASHE